MIAALFVHKGGAYYGLPDVDPWDEERDARKYAGPNPVVAHPPCSRWCQLAHMNQARYGHKVGDDGGCFAAALAAVHRWGGVLEHPAYSYAWPAFDLPAPSAAPGWQRAMFPAQAGAVWVTEVSQCAYGHPAEKLTWLYYVGDAPPPRLDWSRPRATALVSFCANHTKDDDERPRLSKKKASATPIEFRDMLLGIARSATGKKARAAQAECEAGR